MGITVHNKLNWSSKENEHYEKLLSKLRRELGDWFEHFQKSSYVLGSEAWEEYSNGLLTLITDVVLSVWEERKVRLYGEHASLILRMTLGI